jgi:peptidoglycan/xylan/chitin deacetylase (PgdA/CDA1 family)
MPLPDDHLTYPHRRHGMDQTRHGWAPRPEGARWHLPDGRKVAVTIVVPLEWHMLNPSGKPFRHPGAMQTPYPDLRHFTTRDYGNRVGVWRLLEALERAGLHATFAINAALLGRVPPLVEAIVAGGHEVAAHGWDTDSIHHGALDEPTERAIVARTRAAFTAAGLTPTTWMSPARQQSFRTLDLIREHGFTTCLDWETDSIPFTLATAAGPVTGVPLLNELDDRHLLVTQRQTEEEWRRQILEAAAMMVAEFARFGAQAFGFTLTPYISGQPFRIAQVRALLDALAADRDLMVAPASHLPAPSAGGG